MDYTHFINLSKIDFLPKLRGATPKEKADIIQEFVENNYYSPSGFFYSLPLIDSETTARPMTPQEAQICEYGKNYATDESVVNSLKETAYLYENTLTSVGEYLFSQVKRYQNEPSQAAKNELKRAFAVIYRVYQFGIDMGYPGWLGKPYGERPSYVSTPDQYLACLMGMYEYYMLDICPYKDKIAKMFCDIADFSKEHNYTLNFKADQGAWIMINELYGYNAVFMSIQGLAYFVSKDEKYKTELYRMMEMGRWMDETYLDDWERDGIENMLMFERTAIFHFTIHASEILYKTVPFIYGDTIKNQAQRYSEILKMWWKDCQLGINENFENSYWISIDVKNRTWKNTGRTEVKPLNGEEKGVGAMIFFRYYSNVKYAPTLYRYFYSAVVIWEFCPELKVEAANKIVGLAKATNGEKLRWMFDPDGNQLHEANKDYHCTCDSEAPFLYLATYHSATAKGIL